MSKSGKSFTLIFKRWHFVPCRQNVTEAAGYLIGLSNTTATTPPEIVEKHYDRIGKLLGIQVE